MSRRPLLLLFDVNETLVDLAALRPRFARLVGSEDAMGEWFARMLHGSLVANAVGRYRHFHEIGTDQLLVVARRRGLEPAREEAAEVVSLMSSLPAHPDVEPALRALSSAGFRLAALTNGSLDTVERQLEAAGIASLFERRLSVEAVGRFKPAPETYLHAAAVLDVEIDSVMMVAAHDWDVAGAAAVGARTAFVTRPGVQWGLAGSPPDLVVPDLSRLPARLEEA